MKIEFEKIIAEFDLNYFGSKGWMTSRALKCPECGKGGKFGIKYNEKDGGGAVHCFKCEHKDSLFSFIKKIGKVEEFVKFEQTFSMTKGLVNPIFEKEPEPEEELPEVALPKGYERVYYDPYLSSRNFRSHQYEQFEVGITNHFIERRWHDKIIFVLKINGRRVGLIARSKLTKEWHEENLEAFKRGEAELVLRYDNSKSTDFDNILGGYDEITPNTHTVIAVEGLLDKTNVSNLLRTNEAEELKVVFTIGNKFSDNQIKLLRKTNVKHVILMYDFGTIISSKRYSMELSKYFEVDVCYIDRKNVDPGNIDNEYLAEVLSKKENFLYFYTSKLGIKKNLKL